MKLFKKFLFVALVALTSSTTVYSLDYFDYDGISYCKFSDTDCKVIQKSTGKYSGDVVIPAQVIFNDDILNVTTIGQRAFYENNAVSSITLPNSIRTIEICAFQECTGLTSFVIPSSVTEITGNPFTACSNLVDIKVSGGSNFSITNGCLVSKDGVLIFAPNQASVAIPDGVTIIGKDAFAWCYKLQSINIPEGVTRIESNAFGDCQYMKSVTFPNTLTYIGENAFEECYDIEDVTLHNSVTEIQSKAFSRCVGIKTLSLPNSLTTIGYAAFNNCQALETLEIPSNVTDMGYSAFLGCSNLKTVTILNEEVFYDQFEHCSSLETVILSDNVKKIGALAFALCSSLKSITIPASVEEIGRVLQYSTFYNPFYQTPLKEINIEGNSNYSKDWDCLVANDGTVVTVLHKETIVIPSTATAIMNLAVSDANLNTIISLNKTPPVVGNIFKTPFENVSRTDCVVKVPTSAIDAYKTANVWKDFMIEGGGPEAALGICSPILYEQQSTDIYNLSGMKVGKDYKGIVIKDGKKLIEK